MGCGPVKKGKHERLLAGEEQPHDGMKGSGTAAGGIEWVE